MNIVDEFLAPATFAELRAFADTAKYKDELNEVDGVSYPLICADIPADFTLAVQDAIAELFGRWPEDALIFLRLSPAGVPCPHKVHHDRSMGAYSLMLYLNRAGDCQGGTSFVGHIDTGIGYAPAIPDFAAIVQAAQNDDNAWQIHEMAQMKPNRAVIFASERLHRAEPIGGFGTTPADARLVLTCFFN